MESIPKMLYIHGYGLDLKFNEVPAHIQLQDQRLKLVGMILGNQSHYIAVLCILAGFIIYDGMTRDPTVAFFEPIGNVSRRTINMMRHNDYQPYHVLYEYI